MVNRLQEDIHQLPMRSCAISQGVDATPLSYQPKA